MPLSEINITKGIVEDFTSEFIDSLKMDVAVIGAGPSGITCAYYLARKGLKVVVFEKRLYVGGGMWGGGMLFPRITVQEEAIHIPREFGVEMKPCGEHYIGSTVEMVSKSVSSAVDAGAHIWIGMSVEDVLVREEDRVAGVVINWGAVEAAGLHVDPLALEADIVIDATGHESSIAHTLYRKQPDCRFNTDTGEIIGEKSMWAEMGEKEIIENTREVHKGLLVCGMAANAVYGSPRMGAIFGGMLLSGKKAAELAAELLS